MENQKKMYEAEKEALYNSIKEEKNTKQLILSIMKDFAESTVSIDIDSVYEMKDFLDSLNLSLDLSNKKIETLNKIIEKIDILSIPSDNEPAKDETIEELSQNNQTDKTSDNLDNSNNSTITNVENTLVISGLRNCVILPYKISDIEKNFSENTDKYSSIDDVIAKDYTLPLSQYKNPFLSRFSEAFKLMHNKEKSSIKEAFDLGLELMFNYNLHPAIITACKSLDELDIYLDYLQDCQIDKFDIFKIVFELPPVLVKNPKKTKKKHE